MIVASLLVAQLFAVEAACPAYVRSRVDTGIKNDPKAHCLWWKGGEIAWTQSTNGNAETTGDSEFTAISASFATWNTEAVACGNFTLVEKARTFNRDIGYAPNSSDNQNTIVFRPTRCTASMSDSCWTDGTCNNRYDCWQYANATIALTTTTYDRTTGQIYDADLELNDWGFVFTTVDSPACASQAVANQLCVATDVENTVTHEVGHMLGLDHTPAAPPQQGQEDCSQPDSTMHASAPLGEVQKRSLDANSKKFVCDVYPKGKPSRDCIILQVDDDLGDPAGCSATSAGPLAALALLLFRRRRA